jgi:ABC-type sulfate transport system permease subunit
VAKAGLRVVVLAYLAMLLVIPVIVIVGRTFEHGIGPVLDA